MSKEVISCIKKDFYSTFNVPLDGQLLACKITNENLLDYLPVSEKTILLFGKYDVALYYQKKECERIPSHDMLVINRTFCESISVEESTTDFHPYFCQPLHARVEKGKPVNLKFFEQIKSVIFDTKWITVQVEGGIALEPVKVQNYSFAATPVTAIKGIDDREKSNRAKSNDSAEKKEQEVAVGEPVLQMEPSPEARRENAKNDTDSSPGNKKDAGQNKTKENLVTVDLETLVALVTRIIRDQGENIGNHRQAPHKVSKNMEAEKDTLSDVPLARTEKRGIQTNYASPQTVVKKAQEKAYSLPLEKITSRHGLHETFLQNAPPPKPADCTFLSQIPDHPILHGKYINYPLSKPPVKGG